MEDDRMEEVAAVETDERRANGSSRSAKSGGRGSSGDDNVSGSGQHGDGGLMNIRLRDLAPYLGLLMTGIAGVGTTYIVMSTRMTTVEVWRESFVEQMRESVALQDKRLERIEEVLARIGERVVSIEEKQKLLCERSMRCSYIPHQIRPNPQDEK